MKQITSFLLMHNNYFECSYLEPDQKYGYSSINALSKALFDLPYKNINYKFSNLKKYCSVAIQVHIFYIDLIKEIINKTNNIIEWYLSLYLIFNKKCLI